MTLADVDEIVVAALRQATGREDFIMRSHGFYDADKRHEVEGALEQLGTEPLPPLPPAPPLPSCLRAS